MSSFMSSVIGRVLPILDVFSTSENVQINGVNTFLQLDPSESGETVETTIS